MRAVAILVVCLAVAPARADSLWCKTFDPAMWNQPYTKLPDPPVDLRIASVRPADDFDPCLAAPILEKVGLRQDAEAERKRCALERVRAVRLAVPQRLRLTP